MRSIDILRKNIKEISRDKHNLFFILVFPAISLILTGLLIGGGLMNTTADIAVVDLDNSNYSASLIDSLNNISLDNNSGLFNIMHLNDVSQADRRLEDASISAYILIPSNFSRNMQMNGDVNSIYLKGNPTSPQYIITKTVLDIVLIDYSVNLQKDMYNNSINMVNLEIMDNGDMPYVDIGSYMLPALLVFGLLMTINSITLNLAKEFENGMLKRMKLTKMTSLDYVVGNLLTWIVIGIVQVMILITIALLIGFEWKGGFYSLVIASFIGILTMISSIAVSIIIVSITGNSSQASGLATIISFGLSFISESVLFLQDSSVQIFQFIPWAQAIDALSQILVNGNEISVIYTNLFYIILSGLVLIVIAILLFNRKINVESV